VLSKSRALNAANQALAERRLKYRYPLNLGVRFRPLSGPLFCGAGRAVNLSSGGVLIVAEQAASEQIVPENEIRVGARVEMSIEWPSLLDGRTPLQLFAVARVVRYWPSNFAAVFERYQFRTARTSRLSHVRLGDSVSLWSV
jgi:hypothetical protein